MSMDHAPRRHDTTAGRFLAILALGGIMAVLGGLGQTQLAPAQEQPPAKEPPLQNPAPQPAEQAAEEPTGKPLFIDDSHEPMITIAWVQRDGTRVELTSTLPWGTSNDRVDLGLNVLGFAAVGGTRIDLGRGHPLGSVVRVGFYKADKSKPFFADIQPGSTIKVRLEGVRFLEDARPTPGTAVHHLQYNLQDVLDCGLDGSAIDQYNTAGASDTLGGKVTEDNGRPGVLRVVKGELPADAPRYYRQGGEPAGDQDPQPAERFATVRYSFNEETGAIGIRAELPYELFRHVRDPWLRAEPGTFFEPTHFHVEFESLPVRTFPGGVAPREGEGREDEEEVVVGP